MKAHSHRRPPRRFNLAVAAVALVAALTGCVPHPPPMGHTVDQQNTGTQQSFSVRNENLICNSVISVLEVAQTLTAGRTGRLDQVSVVAVPYASALALKVGIHTVLPDGLPSETELGAGSYTGPGSPGTSTLVDVPLSTPAHVVAGQHYAIVLTTAQSEYCAVLTIYGWNVFGASDTYAGGQAYQRGTIGGGIGWTPPFGSNDLFFQTWVRPPD
jgi:hypothetical protein